MVRLLNQPYNLAIQRWSTPSRNHSDHTCNVCGRRWRRPCRYPTSLRKRLNVTMSPRSKPKPLPKFFSTLWPSPAMRTSASSSSPASTASASASESSRQTRLSISWSTSSLASWHSVPSLSSFWEGNPSRSVDHTCFTPPVTSSHNDRDTTSPSSSQTSTPRRCSSTSLLTSSSSSWKR